MNTTSPGATVDKSLKIQQTCTNCKSQYPISQMVSQCKECGGALEYSFEGKYYGNVTGRNDLWKNFELIPLEHESNIVSLGVGGSEIVHLEELSREVNGAEIFLM